MKHTKRFASLLLVLLMALSLMAVPAMAADNGTITINKAVPGETYKIYQIFTLESYDAVAGTYAYKIDKENSPWMAFLTGEGAGASYVEINQQGYVTWNSNKNTEADRAEFAKKALIYAQSYNDNVGIVATREQKAGTTADMGSETTTVTFTGLAAGYYLVDSSLGVLCSLGTATDDTANASIDEKNLVPDIDKKVHTGGVDSNNKPNLGTQNTASIGDTVTFQTTITAKEGAQSYVVHDTMSAGLTFTGVQTVMLERANLDAEDNGSVQASHYTVFRADAAEAERRPSDSCTFEVKFEQTYLNTLKTGDKIIITYTAILNEHAVIAGSGNTNETMLTYGDETHTKDGGKTITYTYSFDLVKTKSDGTLLSGAKFALYPSETSQDPIKLVKVTDAENGDYYRVATSSDTTTTTEIEAGKVTIKGLGSGTYYLEETQQPAGYNKLNGRQSFTINNASLGATMAGNTWTAGGAHVINQTGSELPTTGGMGTTIFYVLGGALMLGAVVLFITKKRMGQAEK